MLLNFVKLRILFLVLFMFGTVMVYAQDKVEKEERIREKEVPEVAREWFYDAFKKIKRPKWYKEFSDSGYSFEAKFKYDNHFHSVEFDSLGYIMDIEIEIDWSELEEQVKSSIENYFVGKFKEYKLICISAITPVAN